MSQRQLSPWLTIKISSLTSFSITMKLIFHCLKLTAYGTQRIPRAYKSTEATPHTHTHFKNHPYTQKPFQTVRLSWAAACVCCHLRVKSLTTSKLWCLLWLGRTKDLNSILNSEDHGFLSSWRERGWWVLSLPMEPLKVCPMEEERPLSLALEKVRGKGKNGPK